MIRISVFVFILQTVFCSSIAQTSQTNGNWTTGSTWAGGTAPPTSGGWVTVNVQNTIELSGNYSLGGTLNIQSSGILTITGNATVTGGSTINVYGTLNINSNVTLNSNLRIYPGGMVVINGSITIIDSQYLTVGTNVVPPPYADLVVGQNIVQNNSGDMTVNRNGRVAVMNDIIRTGGGGGVNLSINNGGQVYVGGNINYGTTGGGNNQISNSNTTNPYGLYIGGTVINSTGGSGTSPNNADEQEMYNSNLPFYNWVSSHFGPLPVTLVYVNIKPTDDGVIINWATSTEQNADYFQIERSVNGITFDSVGMVPAIGNSNNLLKYEFKDDRPFEGKNYYRLKTVDFDGSYEYSKILSVNYEVPKNFNVFPNPYAGDNIHLNTNFAPQEGDKIIVLNPMGVEVTRLQASTKEIEIDYLNPGVYFFRYIARNFEKTVRVIKSD